MINRIPFRYVGKKVVEFPLLYVGLLLEELLVMGNRDMTHAVEIEPLIY